MCTAVGTDLFSLRGARNHDGLGVPITAAFVQERVYALTLELVAVLMIGRAALGANDDIVAILESIAAGGSGLTDVF